MHASMTIRIMGGFSFLPPGRPVGRPAGKSSTQSELIINSFFALAGRLYVLYRLTSFSSPFIFQLNGEGVGGIGGAVGSGGSGTASAAGSSSSSAPASPPPSTSLGANEMATMTDPDSLGPCQPGTAVKLEGIVYHQTDKGEFSLKLKRWPVLSAMRSLS